MKQIITCEVQVDRCRNIALHVDRMNTIDTGVDAHHIVDVQRGQVAVRRELL